MDISDRIEFEVPLAAIPDRLVFAFEEWLRELIRQACDRDDSPERQVAVVEAAHLRDGFLAGSLTPVQVAELAAGAAGWLQPEWPENAEEVGEVEHLASVTRGLLELRDRALVAARSRPQRRVVSLDPGLREVLRSQTLQVLDYNHHRFEEVLDLAPAELLDAAAIFRDALAVLDTIGWLPTAQNETVTVTIAPGHLVELDRLRADLAMRVLDRLDSRERLTEPEEITEADEAIAADRRTVHGLLQLAQQHADAER
ncbi:MAG: hypothetical protein JWQ18_1632 [Conexibacter sp.]|nr:hypothetical protein [Conexibacter sp.]